MRGAALALALLVASGAGAETWQQAQARRPELFHPVTGLRIDRHRSPTPLTIPGPARVASPLRARVLLAAGAVAVDVYGASQSRFDELDGTWLVPGPRDSLPGAIWLPEVGRGVLEPAMQAYLVREIDRASGGDRARPVVVFCVADCWMSWNAAQRIALLGYADVWWYRLGTDGWLDMGWPLAPVLPLPVAVE